MLVSLNQICRKDLALNAGKKFILNFAVLILFLVHALPVYSSLDTGEHPTTEQIQQANSKKQLEALTPECQKRMRVLNSAFEKQRITREKTPQGCKDGSLVGPWEVYADSVAWRKLRTSEKQLFEEVNKICKNSDSDICGGALTLPCKYVIMENELGSNITRPQCGGKSPNQPKGVNNAPAEQNSR